MEWSAQSHFQGHKTQDNSLVGLFFVSIVTLYFISVALSVIPLLFIYLSYRRGRHLYWAWNNT